MSVEGVYSGHQFAFVPIHKEYDKSTRIHEDAHRYLTQASPWGQMIVLLRETMEIDLNKDRVLKYYPSICDVLYEASEFTQESYAILCSIHNARINNDFAGIAKILNSNYAKIYNKKYWDIYLNLEPIDHAFLFCTQLAQFALDTYLLDINSKYWKTADALYEFVCKNPIEFHPDFRFNKIVDETYAQLPNGPNIEFDISVSEILIKSSMINFCLPESKKNHIFTSFKKLLTKVWGNSKSIKNTLKIVSQRINYVNIENYSTQSNYFEIPQPEWNYEPFQFKYELLPQLINFEVIRIYLYEESITISFISNMLKKYTLIELLWKNVKSYIDIFSNNIILSSVDYEFAKKMALFPSSRRVFYYVECHHDAFKEYLKSLGSQDTPYIHFRRINDSTYGIFAQIQDNDILFCFQKKYALNLFINDIINGEYNYVQYNETMIDNIFYTSIEDDYNYGQVVQAILQINTPGSRINILATGIN